MIVIACLYLLISGSLIISELQEEGDLISSESCELRSAPHGDSRFLNRSYIWLLPRVLPATSGRVSVVAIEAAREDIQQNVCPARAFTAYLLEAIAAQGPASIAIDRFYGEGACASDDVDTAALLAAIDILKQDNIPLIVGQSTQPAKTNISKACLVLAPQLSLGKKVQRGLTRLNQEVLRLPLEWPIFLHDGDRDAASGPESYSFSLTTAIQADSTLVPSLQSKNLLIDQKHSPSPQQPYVNLTHELPTVTSTDLLCAAANPQLFKRWPEIKCTKDHAVIDLKNKIVVVGAETETDMQSVLGEEMYGFQLQARYVDALLAKNGYMRQIPPLFLLIPLGIYFVIAELLIPYMHIHRHPQRPLFHIEKPIQWGIGVWCVTMLIGLLVPLAFDRFPPLEVLFGISSTLASRLLIEGWALINEHSEGPHEEGLA